MTTVDLHEILAGIVDPELIDGSGDVAEMSAEQMFLAGTALHMIGARLIKDAKAAMLPRYRGNEGKQVRGRLVVQWSPGGEPTVSLVRKAVEAAYPPEVRPDFWKAGKSKEGLKIEIASRTMRQAPKTRRKAKAAPTENVAIQQENENVESDG
ncbi:MAG: hypothetical protein OXP73_01920 [Chloroflexota bacterium]|nr:hypothetical protein [Chloroflexota bacterium]